MSNIKIFEEKKIRTKWDADKEDWWFCLVDVVEVLTDSHDPTQYLKRLRARDNELNLYLGTNCTYVEMIGNTNKRRKVFAGSTKDILRLIQSIPSPKAEPFKMWLAQVGSDRLDEIADPEKAIHRAEDYYRRKGYSDAWIKERIQAIGIRNELTNEWKERGVSEQKDFAILTNEMTRAWSDMSVKEYKEYKGLKKENLRDNMTNLELTLNQLAEVATTELSKVNKPKTFDENKKVAKSGGNIARNARKDLESQLGRKVISPINANNKPLLEVDIPKDEDNDK